MQGTLGIDKLKVSIPLSQEGDYSPPGWHEGTFPRRDPDSDLVRYAATLFDIPELPGVKVRAVLIDTGYLSLEFNPSRVLHDGYGLGQLQDAEEVLRLVLGRELSLIAVPRWALDYSTGELLSPAQWPQGWQREVSVTRLDAAYDFVPPAGVDVLAELSKRQPKRHKKPQTYTGAGIETVRIEFGKNYGTLQAYDKAVQDTTAPAGTLRVEAQAHNKLLRRSGIRTLADITSPRLVAVLRSRLEQARWDSPMPIGLDPMVLIAQSGVPWEMAVKLVGYLHAKERRLGLNVPARTAQAYEREIDRITTRWFTETSENPDGTMCA